MSRSSLGYGLVGMGIFSQRLDLTLEVSSINDNEVLEYFPEPGLVSVGQALQIFWIVCNVSTSLGA